MASARKTRIVVFVFAALTVLMWRPAVAHVRAASLLSQFSAPSEVVAVDEKDGTLVDGARSRMYRLRDRKSAPGMVIVHGVHRAGIDEPRLVRFARAVASAGMVVLTPEIPELCDYRVDPRSIDRIGDAVHALHEQVGRAKVGVMGLSFAGGLSLLAAADPRFSGEIAFVVAVGAHDDLGRVSRFFATGEIPGPDGAMQKIQAHEYGPLVLVYSHIEDFFPAADVPAARDALRLWLWEMHTAAQARAKDLSQPSRAKMDLLFDHKVGEIAPEILAEVERRKDVLAPVSPHDQLATLKAPVYLLHGAGDTVIPPSETLWLARDVPPALVRDVLVSPAIVHVELEGGPSARDKWALVHFMADVLAEADAG
jgi:dienelactone hydrolase